MVLWNCHEVLIEEGLEAIVARSHQKMAALELWSPMVDGVDEADQPLFVGGEGTVTRHDGLAEVGD